MKKQWCQHILRLTTLEQWIIKTKEWRSHPIPLATVESIVPRSWKACPVCLAERPKKLKITQGTKYFSDGQLILVVRKDDWNGFRIHRNGFAVDGPRIAAKEYIQTWHLREMTEEQVIRSFNITKIALAKLLAQTKP